MCFVFGKNIGTLFYFFFSFHLFSDTILSTKSPNQQTNMHSKRYFSEINLKHSKKNKCRYLIFSENLVVYIAVELPLSFGVLTFAVWSNREWIFLCCEFLCYGKNPCKIVIFTWQCWQRCVEIHKNYRVKHTTFHSQRE